MVFKNFRFGLVLRIIVLVCILSALNYALYKTTWVVTPLVLASISIAVIISLVLYVDKTNYMVSRFLASIEFGDFSVKGNHTAGNSFKKLVTAFAVINAEFQKITTEKETQYHYLQNIIEQVDTGIISYSQTGEVMLYNRSAADMLQSPYLQNIGELEIKLPSLYQALSENENGYKNTIQVPKGFRHLQLSVSKSVIKIKEKKVSVVFLSNISGAISEAEIAAWQKLINVLTHEIMNSITPIVSLASGMTALSNEGNVPVDVAIGLKTIESRGKALLNFVDSYRTLTRIPRPQLQLTKATQLVDNISNLLRKTMDENKVDFEVVVKDENIEMNIDREQMEQVLINLIINALEAVKSKDKKLIGLIVQNDALGKAIVMVNDNGTGISHDLIDQIFVPFFTTKKNGSGIGLSLSRQIVKMHSGNIAVKSTPGEGSSFVISF